MTDQDPGKTVTLLVNALVTSVNTISDKVSKLATVLEPYKSDITNKQIITTLQTELQAITVSLDLILRHIREDLLKNGVRESLQEITEALDIVKEKIVDMGYSINQLQSDSNELKAETRTSHTLLKEHQMEMVKMNSKLLTKIAIISSAIGGLTSVLVLILDHLLRR